MQRLAVSRRQFEEELMAAAVPRRGHAHERRVADALGQAPELHLWTFSDGLATVSLFVEPYDARREPKEVLLALGATYTLTRRLSDRAGDWWLTVVGEVPPRTLEAFAQNIARVAR